MRMRLSWARGLTTGRTPSRAARRSTGFAVELQAAGLDLGEVEHVVDEVEQRLAALEDAVDERRLLLVELAGHAAEQHVAVADDAT